ncbi:hypothetical protein [Gloeocapsopsis sp. IPPAS B-1203]|uniref:hypothetical protein n=1 Tax=Gloeocapsopsis sp. IPPAS B-1203 TaxID=2049454 RepID=UPI0025A07D73|nr:hypothetical protein [Gloeocapsopsis sp. IPPAS B-1203]
MTFVKLLFVFAAGLAAGLTGLVVGEFAEGEPQPEKRIKDVVMRIKREQRLITLNHHRIMTAIALKLRQLLSFCIAIYSDRICFQ